MNEYGERLVWSLTDTELVAALDRSAADLARRHTFHLNLIAAVDSRGLATAMGAAGTAEFLALRHRLDRSEAHRAVRLARALPKYPHVTAALTTTLTDRADRADRASWVFRPAQAEAIVTVLERLPSTVPAEDLEVAERELVRLARESAPSTLRLAARRAATILDTDGPEPVEQAAARRESLVLARVDNGVKFRGYLANDNAELFYSLIHTGARPHKTTDGDLDPRSRDKRQADALSTVLTLAGTASPGAVPGFGAKANLTVTINLDDLKSHLATATGQTVYTDDLSAATIRRLACDAKIIPIVLGSNSEPLDVGRVERLVTRGMRRALNTRDKGCVVCQAPPIHCDAHHLEHWSTGGDTAVHNLVLLCRRHHIDLHQGHWHITITNGTVEVTRPTWADPTPTPTPNQPPTTTPDQPAAESPTRTLGPPPPRPLIRPATLNLTPPSASDNGGAVCTVPRADEPIPERRTHAPHTAPPTDPWADPEPDTTTPAQPRAS